MPRQTQKRNTINAIRIMTIKISNQGSVDDVRCSLKHSAATVPQLQEEIEYEKSHKNRSTVINLIQAKMKKLKTHNTQPES